jgi:hypothetical protein
MERIQAHMWVKIFLISISLNLMKIITLDDDK